MRSQKFALGAQLFRTGREGQVVIRTARRGTDERGASLRMRRTWYAEIFSTGEGQGAATPAAGQPATPAQPASQGQPAATPTTPTDGEKPEPEKGKDDIPDWVKDPTKAYEEIRKLRDENAGHRKTAREAQTEKDKLEAAQKTADEKKLADEKRHEELAQKALKERDEALTELGQIKLENLRLKIATDFKLSPSQSKRLQGSTEEELRKDAEEMVKEFGLDKQQTDATTTQNQPADPARSRTTTTVAPGGQTVGETDAEKLARIRNPYQVPPLFKPPGG